MNVLVIGAGMMGSAMAYDFIRSPGVEKVILADINEDQARRNHGVPIEPYTERCPLKRSPRGP